MRRFHLILAVALLGLVAGCKEDEAHETPDSEPAPAAVTVGVIHQRPESLAFRVDSHAITIDTLVITFGVTELHLCEETSFGWSLIPEAYAHVPSTGTRLGTVFAEDLTSPPGSAQIVGEFEPIHGTYCSTVLVAAPADDDVLNLSAMPRDELIGNTLVVSGTIDDEPFRWATSYAALARVPLERVSIEPGTTVQLLFDKTVSPELFDGVVSLETDEARARTVLKRLMETVTRWSETK